MIKRHARHTTLAATYTTLAATLAYLTWFHFDPDSLFTWLMIALEVLVINLALLAYHLARRSLWGNSYIPTVSTHWMVKALTSTATFLWHGEPTSPTTHPALRTFESSFWYVPFETGRQVIVNKQDMLDWLYDCWTRQTTQKRTSPISQVLADKEIGRYQWQARIWLMDKANTLERNTNDRRSTPKLKYLPYKIIEMIEAVYPSQVNLGELRRS